MTKTYFQIILTLVAVPGSQLQKPLEFFGLRVIKISFVMLMRCLLQSPQVTWGQEAGCWENSPWEERAGTSVQRGWRLSPVVNGQWFNWLPVSNEVSIKPWKVRVQRALRWVSTWKLGNECLEKAGKLRALSPHLALCIFPTWLFLSYILL